MNTRVSTILVACGLAFASACAKQEAVREIDWAKSALARNPAYEIVATDESTGVFTVRDTATGTVQTLRLEDLIAGPKPAKVVAKSEPVAEPAAEPVETPSAPEPDASTLAQDQTTETVPVDERGARPVTRRGPGLHHHAQRTRGRAPEAEQLGANVERRTDPIICQGDRLMRIDGETIEFTGDAVIAEKGCDLYISNARIRAGGVGIIARQARVHIVNSTIGGTRGSYEASQGAEIYVARSTFTGVGRRFDSATMNDLGGNYLRDRYTELGRRRLDVVELARTAGRFDDVLCRRPGR